ESEILAGIDPVDRRLLVQTSIVREICGPLADAVTETSGCGERLYRLSRQNLLVRPVDRQERWYRCHGLLSDLLQRELAHGAPEAARLHARAALWYEQNGSMDDAIDHALRSGDQETVRRIILGRSQAEYRAGRSATVLRWLNRVSEGPLAWDPALSLLGAL